MGRYFEFNKQLSCLHIDPFHLEEGLAEAKKRKYTNIRLFNMDYIEKKQIANIQLVTECSWIKNLTINDDIKVSKESFLKVQEMKNLVSLTTFEYLPLDFSQFKKLHELVLIGGTQLQGIEKLKSLKTLYLANWKKTELPKEIEKTSLDFLRVDAASKLTDISRAFRLNSLKELYLARLPKLKNKPKAIDLPSCEILHLESVAWSDFSWLGNQKIKVLELWNKHESIKFISNLKKLKILAIWENLDGNMKPVLDHPSLKEIYFDKNRRHYSHKESELQKALGM